MSRTKKPRSSKSGFEPDNDKKLRVPAGLFCFFPLPRAATDAVCSFVYRLVATRRAEMAVPEEMEMQQMNFDVVIVGSGLAGLSVALNLAHTRRAAIVAKRSMREGGSAWGRERLGGGRNCGVARRGGQRREPCAGYARRRRRPVRRSRDALYRRAWPRGDRMADRPGRPVHKGRCSRIRL